MKQQLQTRLDELKQEYDTGAKMIQELDTRREALRESMLRISGAIQVLEEELGKSDGSKHNIDQVMQTKKHVA